MWSFFSFRKSQPLTEGESPYLPDDMWVLILCQLHPVFLLDVMRVSKQLNRVAREKVFPQIMEKYIPPDPNPGLSVEQLTKIKYSSPSLENMRDKKEVNHPKDFIDRYSITNEQLHGSRNIFKLFTCIEAGTWYRIPTLHLSPWDLYFKTKAGVDLLTYVNSQNSQELRDIIFSTIYKNFISALALTSTPTLVERVKDIIFYRKVVEVVDYDLYAIAAGLNQIKFLRDYTPSECKEGYFKSQSNVQSNIFLNFTIKYNFEESAILLLQKYKWQWREHKFTYDPNDPKYKIPAALLAFDFPIIVCANFNRTNIYKHLLQYCENTIPERAFYGAILNAAYFSNIEMITLLAADMPDFFANPATPHIDFIKLLKSACQQDDLKTFTTMLEYIPPGLIEKYITDFELSILWYVTAWNKPNILTYLCETIPDISNILTSAFGILVFHESIKKNNVEIVRILLTAGAIPSDEAKQIAAQANVKTEIIDLLNNPPTPAHRGPSSPSLRA